MFGTISLKTERLILEPWHEVRREQFVSLASDPNVMRHIGAAFGRIGVPRLLARHAVANRASGLVMERIGMTFDREATGRHGEVVHVWAIRARWEALR